MNWRELTQAPLVCIGGAIASRIAVYCEATRGETLVLTLCGMGSGLAAFFNQPIGGALFALEATATHRAYTMYSSPRGTSNVAIGARLNMQMVPRCARRSW